MSRSTKGKSWNHAIRALTEQERQAFNGLGRKCARCDGRATYEISFYAVTGGAKSQGQRRNGNCTPHAQAFAARNHLTMPPA